MPAGLPVGLPLGSSPWATCSIPSVDSLTSMAGYSRSVPSYYAPGIDPLVYHHLIWWYPGVLLVAGLILGSVGLIVFNKRDLPTS